MKALILVLIVLLSIGASVALKESVGTSQRDNHTGSDAKPFATIDLGLVDGGSVHRGEFRITNDDVEAWRISHATVSCGCVKVEPTSKKVVLPNQELLVPFTFDPKNRDGAQKNLIKLHLTGNSRPLVLCIVAEIASAMLLRPHGFSGTAENEGGEYTTSIEVRVPNTSKGPAMLEIDGIPLGTTYETEYQTSDDKDTTWARIKISGKLPESESCLFQQVTIKAVFDDVVEEREVPLLIDVRATGGVFPACAFVLHRNGVAESLEFSFLEFPNITIADLRITCADPCLQISEVSLSPGSLALGLGFNEEKLEGRQFEQSSIICSSKDLDRVWRIPVVIYSGEHVDEN